MAINSVRTALQLLSGAGELTRARAMEAAGTLLEMPGVGDTSTRASQLAEELLQAATANQQLVHDLVRTEFERQLTRLGLVRSSDLEVAQRRIEVLEAEVAALREAVVSARTSGADAGSPARRPARSAATKATTAKRTTATKKTAKKATATKKTAKKAAATKKTAKKAAATKSTTKRSSGRGTGT